jgi:hypothetical protein
MFKTEVTNGDLTTKEGWDTYLEYCCKETAKRAAKEEIVLVDCVLVCTVDPETGLALERPLIAQIASVFNGPDDKIDQVKQDFYRLLRATAVVSRAFASVFTSEAWLSHQDDLTAPLIKPKNDPKREEVVMINSEHRDYGLCMHSAIIHGTATNRTVGPWRHRRPDRQHQLLGDAVSFVPPTALLADKRVCDLAREYYDHQRKKMEILFRKEPHAAS